MLTGMFNTNECPYECEYSTDKNKYLNASAIVYYIRSEHLDLPKIRLPNQLYVFCLDEPPHYTFEFFKVLEKFLKINKYLYKDVSPDFFNISMTYRLDSDIYYPYDTFVPCNGECQLDEYWTEKEVMENVIRKTGLAMQVNSDCGRGVWIFQQDSAPAHKAKEVQDWCKANFPGFISAQEWPPYSPDLNPMDYSVWSILESRACAKPHKSLESLRHSLTREWDLITLKEVRAICENFSSRLRLCIKAKGGHFETS
uniref:Uncharacterized protein n=1 Tax=Meloidogyne enterolobii TaxID=390850 RepID=A0A6V7UQ27_MELEN|nr:unnamed protein product [Meloidogyne enterolobii]